MLIRLYVETLLADEKVADQVWELWNAGDITDDVAALAWFCVQGKPKSTGQGGSSLLGARRLL